MAEPSVEERQKPPEFTVDLGVYQGPFDALLALLADRKLELSQISLAEITDDFLHYVSGLDMVKDADRISSFIDVASILIEAKSASLLPRSQGDDQLDQSMEALRQRDLLFARLLQYRAFKEAGENFRQALAANSGRFAHPGYMDQTISLMLPELAWSVSPIQLAQIAAAALANAPLKEVRIDQLHVPMVDLQVQADIVRSKLRSAGRKTDVTFDSLIADTSETIEVVARFLALLAFFKQGTVQFKQEGPFQSLHVRWVGTDQENDDRAGASPISQEDFA